MTASVLLVSCLATAQSTLPPLPPLPDLTPPPESEPTTEQPPESEPTTEQPPESEPTTEQPPAQPLPVPTPAEHLEPPVVRAQTPSDTAAVIARGGSYFGIGLGLGASNLIDETFAGNSVAALNLRFGGILDDRLLIGVHAIFAGQYNDWARGDIAGLLIGGMAELMVFPFSHLGWNLSAALGYAYVHTLGGKLTSQGGVAVVSASDHGFCWMLATGYDFFAGRGLNVGLQLRYHNTILTELASTHTGTLNLWFAWY